MPEVSSGEVRSIELGRVERLVALRSVRELRELSSSELAMLSAIARPRWAPAGALLAHEGRPVGSMFVVVDGELRVRRGSRDRARVGPHDLACAVEALASDPAGCECAALLDTIVLEIAIDDLEDAAEDQPGLLVALVRRVAREALALARDAPGDGSSLATEVPETEAPEQPVDLVDRMLFLRRSGALGARSIDGVAALAVIAREVRFAPGESLWRAGDPSAAILAVVAGGVAATTAAGRRFSIGPGELAGELDCLAGEPRFFDAAATGSLVALAFDHDTLLDAWEDHVDLGVDLLRALGRAILARRG